jgi:hypothetical protein
VSGAHPVQGRGLADRMLEPVAGGVPAGDARARSRARWAKRAGPELAAALLGFLALTLVVFRDLLPRFGEAAPHGADLLGYLWDGWWVHRALLVDRVSPYWTDWINWPRGVDLLLHSLALSVVAPWVWLVEWYGAPHGVVLAHNAAVLASFVLTGVGLYALAASQSGSRVAALVAAIAFSFSAHRFFLLGRIDLLSTQWVVFFVVALLQTLRGSLAAAVAGGASGALIAYNNLTHLLFGALLAAGLLVADPRGTRRSARQIGVLLAVQAALCAPLIWVWIRALGIEGTEWSPLGLELAASGGADPRHLILPQRDGAALDLLTSWLPGDFPEIERLRRNRSSLGFETVYVGSSLGYSLLALVAAGALSPLGRGARCWLVLGLVFVALALGPHPVVGTRIYDGVPLPYLLLRAIPGFAISRFPDRFMMPGLLCLSVFAACALARGLDARCLAGRTRAIVAGLAIGAVLIEYCWHTPSLQALQPSQVSLRLGGDDGDYAIAYFPTSRSLRARESQMWDQVAHHKRILTMAVARAPLGVTDPLSTALHAPGQPSGAEDWIAGLEELLDSEAHRVKFLAVFEGPPGRDPVPTRVRRALRDRYPRWVHEREAGSGLLAGFYRRTWYYVGGEGFRRDVAELEQRIDGLEGSLRGARSRESARSALEAIDERFERLRSQSALIERSSPEWLRLEERLARLAADQGLSIRSLSPSRPRQGAAPEPFRATRTIAKRLGAE